MNWATTASRIFFATLFAALLGWLYGYPVEAVALALGTLVLFWIYQMQRVQTWLQDPQTPPPDVSGIWGELIARIYLQQRKNAEIQVRLQSHVDYLQDSFTSMRDGVVMVDELGAVKWLNQAVGPLLGLRYPEDTGQTLTNLVRSPEFHRYFSDGDYSTPLQYVTTGDIKSYLRVEITHFGEGDRLLFVRDVSEAVRMEEIRRDFVANVSHELRTPLTVISGYLGAFQDNASEIPAAYVKSFEQMAQQAHRMENLLKDLLWLSQVENESSSRTRELIDFRGLLHELEAELHAAYPEFPVEIEVATDGKIYGNYRELSSAASNLAINAIKYTTNNSPVHISWSLREGNYVLQVRDRGIGIDAIHIPRLTERFYRVDGSRSSVTGGTGLGLAIVKHVAQAHDAVLEIESQLGEGSTFSLLFPVGG